MAQLPTRWRSIAALFLALAGGFGSAEAITVRDYTNIRDSADLTRFRDLKIYVSGSPQDTHGPIPP